MNKTNERNEKNDYEENDRITSSAHEVSFSSALGKQKTAKKNRHQQHSIQRWRQSQKNHICFVTHAI